MSGNPLFKGWYADPDAVIFGDRYFIYPTYSDAYEKQTFFDAFSSPDLVHWTKHPRILSKDEVKWAHKAMWAPCAIEKDGKYYLFFSANDVHPGEVGGIGVAVADEPEGPFKDLLGKPLVNDFPNDAQPIDQCVFQDTDGQWYLLYGGWRRCNLAKLKSDFTALEPYADGATVREITPEHYVEGPMMFRRKVNGKDKVYFMWSEGGWTGDSYRVAYAMADTIFGPFQRIGTVLVQNRDIASGAGHHSVLHIPNADEHYIVYHRRPAGRAGANERETCIEKLNFNEDGTIVPVPITREGVPARALK
ncbi:MAG: glycoside hydrolase family 43 protein [Tepidisphaeraceae bacterium]